MQNEIKKIIFLPKSIKIYKKNNFIIFNSLNQYISLKIPNQINLIRQGSILILETPIKNINLITWGFLCKNIIIGVTRNFSERLQLKGVGFKASQINPNKIELKIGYSHNVLHTSLVGTKVELSKNTLIQVKSPLKNLVGQEASNLQKLRLPDIYKGKGILYKGEKLNLKIGKKA